MTSLLWHGLLALGAGVLLNATPCVLPVIPFKVQAVLRDIGHSRRRRVLAALAMLSGSLLFFAVLGGATIALGLTWGALFSSKAFVAGLTLFLLAAGLFTLTERSVILPQWVYAVQGQKYVGAFLAGLLTGVLATPCGGPFLGAVLAYGLTQPPLIGLMIFLSIGTGLVLPYMLLLVWPWLSQRSIKTGPWAGQIKQLLGFVLLGGAAFFAQSLVPPQIGRLLWVALIASLAGWTVWHLWGRWSWGQRAVPLAVGLLSMFCAGFYFLGDPARELHWQPYAPQVLAQAANSGRPVLLEFTAEWCLNCKVLESTTYADADVIAVAQQGGVVPVRVDLTQMAPDLNRLLVSYGGKALPFVVLIDHRGQVSTTFTGLFTADTLIGALSKLSS